MISFSPILYSDCIWIPPSRSPIYLINAVYLPKGSERRAAVTRSGPREPAYDQAVRPHEGAAHPRRGGEDQAVSSENGAKLEDAQGHQYSPLSAAPRRAGTKTDHTEPEPGSPA